tara:strand:+ start:324 stop:536 length:213 start_codon:yes stop_codon:yes gene_type:complete
MLKILDNIDRGLIVWLHENHVPILNQIMPFITDADNWTIPILFLILYLGFFEREKRENCSLFTNYITVNK